MDFAVAFQAHAVAWLFAIAAVVCFGVALCWALNRKWRARRLAKLRARYAEMQPSDSNYNQVRALYIDMTVAAYGAAMIDEAVGDGSAAHDSVGGDASSESDGSAGSSGGD